MHCARPVHQVDAELPLNFADDDVDKLLEEMKTPGKVNDLIIWHYIN